MLYIKRDIDIGEFDLSLELYIWSSLCIYVQRVIEEPI